MSVCLSCQSKSGPSSFFFQKVWEQNYRFGTCSPVAILVSKPAVLEHFYFL